MLRDGNPIDNLLLNEEEKAPCQALLPGWGLSLAMLDVKTHPHKEGSLGWDYYTIQAVPDSKAHRIQVVTAYIAKNKNGAVRVPDVQAPGSTSQNEAAFPTPPQAYHNWGRRSMGRVCQRTRDSVPPSSCGRPTAGRAL